MWFSIGFESFICRVESDDTNTNIKITNFVYLWQALYKNSELISKFKEQNPSFDFSDESAALEKALKLFTPNGSNICRTVEVCSGHVLLSAATEIRGYRYEISLHLSQSTPEKLFEDVTSHFLKFGESMQDREQRLIQMLHEKDAELEEYRLEGYEIKRRGLVTVPFVDEEFNENISYVSNEDLATLFKILQHPCFEKILETSAVQKAKVKPEESSATDLTSVPVSDQIVNKITTSTLIDDTSIKTEDVMHVDRKKRKLPARTKLKI